MTSTLYDIYKNQGQALPNTAEARFADPKFASAASQAGITKDQYKVNAGNADYNTRIANMYGKTPVTSTVPTTPPVTPVSSTTAPVTPVTPVTSPTMSDIYGNDAINSANNTYNSYLTNPDSYLNSQGISESDFRAKALAEMQGAIDSTNAMYANKLSQSKRSGAGVLGSTGAIQARRGLLGSDFGQAQVDNVNTANQEVYDNIEQERLARINDIMSKAKEDSSARYAKAVEAGEKGLKFKLENLRQAQNQLKTGADQAAQVLLASKTDFSTMTNDEINAFAKEYGTNKGAIQAALSLSRYATEKEKEKREEELANDLAKKGIQDISKGATGYAYNPKTKKYELVARAASASINTTSGNGIRNAGVSMTGTGNNKYSSDLDAILGNTLATIPSKFGQATFNSQISKARNDGDKINTVASVLLANAPATERTDFANQAKSVNQIDKAISLIDSGVKTGVLQAGGQYVYNLAGKDFDPNLATINQLITSAIQPYRNSITGAAWGDQEDGEYQNLFGSTKYSPTELKQRLQGVKEIMKNNTSSALNNYVNPMGSTQNYFQGNQQQNINLQNNNQVDNTEYNYDADLASAQRAIQRGDITKQEASRLFNEKYSGNTKF